MPVKSSQVVFQFSCSLETSSIDQITTVLKYKYQTAQIYGLVLKLELSDQFLLILVKCADLSDSSVRIANIPFKFLSCILFVFYISILWSKYFIGLMKNVIYLLDIFEKICLKVKDMFAKD